MLHSTTHPRCRVDNSGLGSPWCGACVDASPSMPVSSAFRENAAGQKMRDEFTAGSAAHTVANCQGS
jgi:hypothetical protein